MRGIFKKICYLDTFLEIKVQFSEGDTNTKTVFQFEKQDMLQKVLCCHTINKITDWYQKQKILQQKKIHSKKNDPFSIKY